MNPEAQFDSERANRIAAYKDDTDFHDLSIKWVQAAMQRQYVYNFGWLGRPIIQFPQDIVALQEIIWATRPTLIIETGIAHGGSLIFNASILALLDLCDANANNEVLDPRKTKRTVLGIDIDIRRHNEMAIKEHPLSNRIKMIEGSSICPNTLCQVEEEVALHKRVMVCLDSNHTHDHVLAELEGYAKFVSPGNYCVVFDTFVEDMPLGFLKIALGTSETIQKQQ